MSNTIQLPSGKIVGGLTTITANATANAANFDIYLCNPSGAITVTLPTAAGITGQEFTIKNLTANAVTVATTSSQTIDGATTYALAAQWKYVRVVSNGSNWLVVASN
jgi:hypothetical protein